MRSALILSLLALAACNGVDDPANELDLLDAELAEGQSANGVDPLLMAALNDPIMVDPQLASKSNADAIRPPPQPYSGAVPFPGIAAGSVGGEEKLPAAPAPRPLNDPAARGAITLAALARAMGGPAAACAARLTYAANWAGRLPPMLPLHPDARVIEAAGVDGTGCSLRAASLYVAQPAQRMIDWHAARASRAGFPVEHRADGAVHRLSGARGAARYRLYLTDRGDGGTDIDLIATGGS